MKLKDYLVLRFKIISFLSYFFLKSIYIMNNILKKENLFLIEKIRLLKKKHENEIYAKELLVGDMANKYYLMKYKIENYKQLEKDKLDEETLENPPL